jgi:hypothetical protein
MNNVARQNWRGDAHRTPARYLVQGREYTLEGPFAPKPGREASLPILSLLWSKPHVFIGYDTLAGPLARSNAGPSPRRYPVMEVRLLKFKLRADEIPYMAYLPPNVQANQMITIDSREFSSDTYGGLNQTFLNSDALFHNVKGVFNSTRISGEPDAGPSGIIGRYLGVYRGGKNTRKGARQTRRQTRRRY